MTETEHLLAEARGARACQGWRLRYLRHVVSE